jgi:D-alanine--poly(phosphoribitol) ligase subunit 1
MQLIDRILSRAESAPTHPAVKDGTRSLSYGELSNEIRRVAVGLREIGVEQGDRVAIRLPTSVDALVSAYACIWLGAIFVPLSPIDPILRIASILDNCDPALVIERLGAPGDEVPGRWNAETFEAVMAVGSDSTPRRAVGTRAAYCIYTSGTTGTPKGVLVDSESFGVAIDNTVAALGLNSETRGLCISAFHFDGAFGTLFPVPSAGGSLVILRREPMLLPRMFIRAVLAEDIDVAMFSPSFLRLLIASPELATLAGSSLKTVGFGGEASSAKSLLAFDDALRSVRLFNRYGPTETVIAVTTHEIDPEELRQGSLVPIGRPHPGVSFRLFDSDDNPVVKVGEVGELYIGGDQLMEGYWGDPELTARVMRQDLVPGDVLYRTGDLVMRDDRGNYIYVGRADRVVKRSGIRISLDEIETVLRNFPSVANAACTSIQVDEDLQIRAFVVSDDTITPQILTAAARDRLPSTMIPDVTEIVDSLPLTPAGKIDYRALMRGSQPLHACPSARWRPNDR